MARRIKQQRQRSESRHGNLVDWLASLDGWAQEWTPAKSWLHPYDYFVLTRYPRLQPVEDAVGKEVYERQLARQLIQLASCSLRILKRLTPEQQKQVAALVYELSLHFEEHRRYAEELARLRELIKSWKRLEREVGQAKRKIDSAIERVLKFASALKDPVGSNILAASCKMKQRLSPQDLESWMNALVRNDYFRLFASDPSILAMVQLYWLFRHGFGFDAGESELRTALIRNCLWTNFVKPVRCISRKMTDQPIGCDAVRKAVRRFRLPKGTTS